MHRTSNIGRELSALDRIVAALLVLAGLAEDAAVSAWPVRCSMLWLLRCADARVKDFAGRYVFSMGLPQRLVVTPFDGDSPAAALSLALSLRVLASVIRDMIARLRRRHLLFGRRSDAGTRLAGRRRHRVTRPRRPATPCAAIADTS